MSKKRRQHSPDLKARVGLEALKGIEPVHARLLMERMSLADIAKARLRASARH